MRSLRKYNLNVFQGRLEPVKICATEVEPLLNPGVYKLYNELHNEKYI